MHLLRALLYLRFMSLRNVLRSRLRRLRQPKYLLGAIAGGGYFWFFFFRGLASSGNPGELWSIMFGENRAEIALSFGLTLFILSIWVTPSDQPGLAFSEAEVAFLFPAPLARRQLIHYKLIDGLLTSLFGALFFTLLSGGLRLGWIGALRHLGSWWSLNANLALHQSVAALAIARLSSFGLRTAWRRTLLLGGGALLVIAVIVVARKSGLASLSWLLWPARLAVRPFLADSLGLYFLALAPAAGLVALQYFLVHRMESPFEEASIVRARKTGEMVARIRAGKGVNFGGTKTKAQRASFRLGDRLPVEAAFLWKNLMAAPAYINRRLFLGLAAIIFLGFTWLKNNPEIDGPKIAAVTAFIALVFLGYVLIFGPHLARNDLRGDLLNADMLKAYPLPGWRIVLGGLLAPTVILTGVAWLLLLAAALGLTPPSGKVLWLTPQLRVVAVSALAVIMPALCSVQLLVPNAATLLFPAWAQTSRNMSGGMDVLGQRLIFFAGQLICLVFALLPAAVLAGGTIFLTQWLIGLSAAVVLAVVPVLVVFAGEVWLGVRWLGPKFERLDISSELRP